MYLIPDPAHDVAEVRNELHEVLQLLLIRVLMDAIEEWHLQPVEVLSYGLIRSEHELLDDHLGNRTLALNDICRLAVLVDENLRLCEVEVNRAAIHPLLAQTQRQALH